MELNRENPGATLIWFGQTHRNRSFDSTPTDWRIWCLHEDRSGFHFYRQFKALDEAYTQYQRERGIGPGGELMWFGQYEGRTIASVYTTDNDYLDWCLDGERAHRAWYPRLKQLVTEYRHEIGELEEEDPIELQYPQDDDEDATMVELEPTCTPGAVLMWFGEYEGFPLYYVAHRREYMEDLLNNMEHREKPWYPRFIQYYREFRDYVGNENLGAGCAATP